MSRQDVFDPVEATIRLVPVHLDVGDSVAPVSEMVLLTIYPNTERFVGAFLALKPFAYAVRKILFAGPLRGPVTSQTGPGVKRVCAFEVVCHGDPPALLTVSQGVDLILFRG